MNKLVRFYNQNRHIVWVVILSIAAVIVVIQILDKFAYEKNNTSKNVNISNNNNIDYNYSIITGEEVNKNVSNVVDEFIEFCNNGQIENAYEMLSEECKKNIYPSLEDFTKKYYNKIFSKKRAYNCQAWISQGITHTYRIDFTEDMLATGSPAQTSIVDYYTVVKNNDEYKLNINKYIGNQFINKAGNQDEIIIYIQKKNVYMDYEIYTLEIVNNTTSTIKLDNMESTDNIYLEDNNGQKYFWYNHEILESDIVIEKRRTQKIDVKFNKEYNTNIQIEKMVFEKIMIDNKTIEISIEI